jgi:hypothetical protein
MRSVKMRMLLYVSRTDTGCEAMRACAHRMLRSWALRISGASW